MGTAAPKDRWKLWVDTGGTFTDCLALSPHGELRRIKVLSTGRLRAIIDKTLRPNTYHITSTWTAPQDFLNGTSIELIRRRKIVREIVGYDPERSEIVLAAPLPKWTDPEFTEIRFDEEAPTVAARLATATPFGRKLPPIEMRLATTKATNALLERKGDRTVFFVTKGFKDLLVIGNQQRPDLFDLNIRKTAPLYDRVIEVEERLNHRGEVIAEISLQPLADTIESLRASGFAAAAITFLHAFRNPIHEITLRDYLKAAGFKHISTSHELAPMIKILPRAETSVANAYLAPLMDRHIQTISDSLKQSPLHLMTSAGGLMPTAAFRPKDALLSGPAGGAIGAAVSGQEAGFDQVITFDMGGTSTDVSRYEGKCDYQFEHQVGPARLIAPALRIKTVAAGGGSICGYSPHGLFVGPESAGASPGPACYGAGGPLTITDVNLLLGRMDPDHFGIPVHVPAARAALRKVVHQINAATQNTPTPESLLAGYLEIANERMADTIREISLREGYAPSQYALVAFGGAGGQHACQLADRLDIRHILFPKNAGLLSAHGLRHARLEQFAESQILQPLDEIENDLPNRVAELEATAKGKLCGQGFSETDIEVTRRLLQLRLLGQEATEDIEFEPGHSVPETFKTRYQSVFGYYPENKPIELVSIYVSASVRSPALDRQRLNNQRQRPQPSKHLPPPGSPNAPPAPVFLRHEIQAHDQLIGPAIVQDEYSTIFIDEGWESVVHPNGTLILERHTSSETAKPKPKDRMIEEELFAHRFQHLVSEMGSQLERTSVSTNVKDRLDFSCALLDETGELVANAPHIPVHLGALGACTRTIAERLTLEPGDMIVTNHPGFGGSHLPDVTVISPVYDQDQALVGYVANRAHHAEIGGKRPGSMPPDTTNLEEEGVIIPPTHLFKSGQANWQRIESILTQARFPTRALDDNLADLRAQAAANLKGVHALRALCDGHGSQTVHSHMRRLKERAEKALITALSKRPPFQTTVTEQLDDGTPITITTTLRAQRLTLDFAGTGLSHQGNFNANPAIINSAIIYVIRLLINQPLPLNEGLLKPVDVQLPTSFLNPEFPDDPSSCPAVAAGNVETSQRVVDTLIKALGLAACSQGTMNNLIFGNDRVSYYETIGGGAGAAHTFDGASGVHTHMTNTGITDPEILENRYPVTLDQFAIRPHSGGQGQHSGGHGLIRQLTFTEPVKLSLLTQHRVQPPFGAAGGAPGKPGAQSLRRCDGSQESLSSTASIELNQGDTLIIETPGGGGWGPPPKTLTNKKAKLQGKAWLED
ncbi:MAG: Acetophenone carboxylase gamma subunit [Verrucomicrobia subdivision 3 bacterium]|nr:Acetophenone carboxylase gamma subunit [Limisphaerales bacterium]